MASTVIRNRELKAAENATDNKENAQSMNDEDEENILRIAVDSEVQLNIKADNPQAQDAHNSDSSSSSDGMGQRRANNYVKSVPNSEDRMLFQCTECPFTDAQKWKVASHVRATHMKKKETFKCPFCSFTTSKKIEYCIHKTKHSSKPVFSCKECSFETTSGVNYDRHFASHRNPGPVKCSQCSYSSSSPAAIQRHVEESHGENKDDLDLNDTMDTIEEDTMEASQDNIQPPEELQVSIAIQEIQPNLRTTQSISSIMLTK